MTKKKERKAYVIFDPLVSLVKLGSSTSPFLRLGALEIFYSPHKLFLLAEFKRDQVLPLLNQIGNGYSSDLGCHPYTIWDGYRNGYSAEYVLQKTFGLFRSPHPLVKWIGSEKIRYNKVNYTHGVYGEIEPDPLFGTGWMRPEGYTEWFHANPVLSMLDNVFDFPKIKQALSYTDALNIEEAT